MEWLAGKLRREGRERDSLSILQELASTDQSARRSMALCKIGALHSQAGRWRQAEEAYEQQLALAQATPTLLGTGMWKTGATNLIALRRIHGDAQGALALTQFVVDHEDRCLPETVRMARQQRAYVLHQIGNVPGAEAAAADFLQRYPEWNPPNGDRTSFVAFHSRLLRETGRAEDALAEAQAAWRLCRGSTTSKTVKLGEELCECLRWAGRESGCIDVQTELLDRVDEAAESLATERTALYVEEVRHRLLVSLSEADRAGRPEVALRALERLGPGIEPANRGDHDRAVARARAALQAGGR